MLLKTNALVHKAGMYMKIKVVGRSEKLEAWKGTSEVGTRGYGLGAGGLTIPDS
jgi:hypothetical protein